MCEHNADCGLHVVTHWSKDLYSENKPSYRYYITLDLSYWQGEWFSLMQRVTTVKKMTNQRKWDSNLNNILFTLRRDWISQVFIPPQP